MIEKMQNTKLIDNSLAIWGMGQMGVALTGSGATIYMDICLSDVVREQFGDWWTRAYDPPVLPEEVTNADFYFISHEHLDHLDPLTVAGVLKASPDVKFVTCGWCIDSLKELGVDEANIIVPAIMEKMTLPDTDIQVSTIPAAHYDKEYDDEKGYRYIGFIIEWNGVTFYHAGDTIIYDDYIENLKKLPTPDVALLPVNGRDYYREADVGAVGNLLPAEAVRLAHDLNWDVIIFGHNDMYANNAIPFAEHADAVERISPRQKYKILQPGELFYYVK